MQEIQLGAEVVGDRSQVRPGSSRDLSDRGGARSLARKQLPGCVEQSFLCPVLVLGQGELRFKQLFQYIV